ncbi:MAG: hypothetical protein AB2A00_12635 [Myxococcota bacterium]
MPLASRREQPLTRALEQAGWTIRERHTTPMSHGDVVETDLWRLTSATGQAATLLVVSEVGFGAGFPPVLKVLGGDLDVETAKGTDGVEVVADEPWQQRVQDIVDALRRLAGRPT